VLRGGDNTEIVKMFERLRHEAREVVKSCIRLAYWMRASCPYDSMLQKSFGERSLMDEFVAERLKEMAKMPNQLSM